LPQTAPCSRNRYPPEWLRCGTVIATFGTDAALHPRRGNPNTRSRLCSAVTTTDGRMFPRKSAKGLMRSRPPNCPAPPHHLRRPWSNPPYHGSSRVVGPPGSCDPAARLLNSLLEKKPSATGLLLASHTKLNGDESHPSSVPNPEVAPEAGPLARLPVSGEPSAGSVH
jgi:hypothetical protein